jgi:hypothetical protein
MRKELFKLEEAKQLILAEELPFLPIAEEFLSRYGGLYVHKYVKIKEHGYVTEICNFDAVRAVNSVDGGWYHDYSKRIGKPVTPIGQCSQAHMSLCMSDDGCVYGGFDELLYKIADSGEEAVLAFCTRDQSKQIKIE